MHRALAALRVGAISYERGTPVGISPSHGNGGGGAVGEAVLEESLG